MTRATLLIVLTLLPLIARAAAPLPDADGFVPMFNGKDLSGWVPCNVASGTDGKDTFTIKDGVVYCTGKPTGVLRTDRMYENFIVEVEWRHMVPGGNSGIFLWADDITSRGVPFSRGIEVQVLDGPNHPQRNHTTHGDIFPIHGATAKPDNPAGKPTQRSYPTEDRSKPSPEWNHYRIEANNGVVTLAVNGKVVTSTRDCSPRKGYFCLESEGGVVEFRNLRIKELPPSENLDPKHVAIADRGFKSIYTGVDLSGWTATDAAKSAWSSRDWILHFEPPKDAKETGPLTLTTTRNLPADFEFLFDIRQSKAERIVLFLGDRRVTITPPPLAAAPAKPGWRRVTLQRKGPDLTATVDNVAVKPIIEGQPAPAADQPLGLAPTSATDYANLYVRPLK